MDTKKQKAPHAQNIVHVERLDYELDNRDSQETELHFTHKDTRFTVRVDPWDLLDNVIANVAGLVPLYQVRAWREALVDLHEELEASIDTAIQKDK